MSLLSDKLLAAYVERRLNPTEEKLIADIARFDPQLRRRIDHIKIIRSFEAPNNSGRSGSLTRSRPHIANRRLNVVALLAMLAIGFALHWGLGSGFGIRGFKNDDLLVVRNSTVFASGSLLQALESAGNSVVTAQKGASRHITPLLTFKDRRKLICREYDIDADWNRQFSGVACRLPNGVWRVETHIATGVPKAAEKSFAPASNGTVATVEHLSERMKTGKAFNDAEVDNLLKSRWRAQ